MAGSKKTFWSLALEIAGEDKGASEAIYTIKKQLEDLKGAADQLGKDWKNFTNNATKLAVGVAGGVVAATAGIVTLANTFAETGDKVAKTSARLGIDIEAYQGLSYAMKQSGLSIEEFDGALEKFNLTVRQGAAGNEAMQKQLAAIGLSANKLAGMKPEQAMERLSDYMQSLSNDAERTRVAVTLFGKTAGPKMMAAMKQGSTGLQMLMNEAKSLGAVLTEEQAHQSESYIDAMNRLKTSVTGYKNQFIGGAIGPLTEAFDHLKDAVVEQMPAIHEIGKAFGQWLGDVVRRLPEIIAKIKEFGAWVKNTVTRIKDFAGGWKNLAKILAGLAIAPTLISGLKVIWSFGNLINTAIGAWPKILAKIAPAFAGISGAALLIIGIIAGIALVVYTVVRNFDTLKKYALDCIDRIKSAFGGATGGMAVDWQKVGEVAKTVLGIIEQVVLFGIITAMNILTSAIQYVIEAFKAFWNIVKLIFWPLETIIKVIIGLFTGGWSGAIEAAQGQFGKLGEIVSGIFDGIKIAISGVVDFIKGLSGGIKDLIGGIGNLFGKGKDIKVAAHATGGIFTHRHIAEIAEKGAEAVVPLNNTPHGFDIWKQAGEIGGYLKRASEQAASDKSPEPSPVMAAATQKISSGDTVVTIDFKMTNNFGGTPNGETVKQISEAGQKAGDDLTVKIKSVFEAMMRENRRISYGVT
jgi:hypothetical protein